MPKKIKNEREVRRLCKAGQKITAIGVLRASNPSLGLHGSKVWIEKEYPALRPPEVNPEIAKMEGIVRDFASLSDAGKNWVRARLAAC